jgi:hypothetical protein
MHRLTCLVLLSFLLLTCLLQASAASEPVRKGDATPSRVPFSHAKVELQLLLPLERKAYQTNEWIDVSVVRHSTQALPAGDLVLRLQSEEGSALSFTFPLRAVAVVGKEARATEHLHLNGWLLRPGKYTLAATIGGASASTTLEIYSHIRKSSFRLVDWASRATGAEQATLGEDGLGFNLLYASYGGLSADDTIRGGLDYMWCCTMGGGHQMDLRLECDWADPYVLQGGTARVVRRAFQDRTHPNAIGVHFYDEPGLTWHNHPVTKEFTPHNVPAQDRAYRSAFGKDAPVYYQVKPTSAEDVARWRDWGRWKLSFMDAAWREAAFGVSLVRPDFLSVTQSIYGWPAYTDGYYFNVTRSLRVTNGHGGYDDGSGGYFYPGFTLEFGRARDLQKPLWYLPTWYGGMPSPRFRLEQYLSFMTNVQGLMKPPDQTVQRPTEGQVAADGIVESNKLMARLGTIFATMPVSRPEVAVLYSISQDLGAQVRDMSDNYLGGRHAREKTFLLYLAGKVAQIPLFPIVEEDITDGTLAAHHKAVVLAGVHYLDSIVIQALEDFGARGGTVVLSDDSRVQIKGAVKLGAAADVGIFDQMTQLWKENKQAEYFKVNTAGNFLKTVQPLAQALTRHFHKFRIPLVFQIDGPGIVASRQGQGDIEYLFAVNASYDDVLGGTNALRTASAMLNFAGDRPVYDAVLGGKLAHVGEGIPVSLPYRFGPGQMRVFAQTERPIGGVQALTPVVSADYTLAQEPVRVEIGAALTDAKGRILAGSAPLQIRLFDPLHKVRYDLYRATDHGVLKLQLPLGLNDPAGQWQVVVRDLLANTEDRVAFTYTPPAQAGALAGATPRAVYFGNDRDNIYRFFRLHHDVTLVVGSSDYDQAAAERLATTLKPWGVRCKLVKAAAVNRPRPISADEAKTWCGLEPGRVQPGTANNPALVGFDVAGPVVLLGTPEDNPLIQALQQWKFLPYKPDATNFPGRGRGFLAWQEDGVGYGQESVTLIAYDGEGMAEAVGSLYEAAAGIEPLTRWLLPARSVITAAHKGSEPAPSGEIAWRIVMPDRVVGIAPLAGRNRALLSQDGTLTVVNGAGGIEWTRTVSGGEVWRLAVSADGEVLAVGATYHLVGFDSKDRQLFDVPLSAQRPASAVHLFRCRSTATASLPAQRTGACSCLIVTASACGRLAVRR